METERKTAEEAKARGLIRPRERAKRPEMSFNGIKPGKVVKFDNGAFNRNICILKIKDISNRDECQQAKNERNEVEFSATGENEDGESPIDSNGEAGNRRYWPKPA